MMFMLQANKILIDATDFVVEILKYFLGTLKPPYERIIWEHLNIGHLKQLVISLDVQALLMSLEQFFHDVEDWIVELVART